MTSQVGVTQRLIEGLVTSSGQLDPVRAVRSRARHVVDSFVEVFGDPEELPLDLLAVASFLGIKIGNSIPLHSPDAELAPDGNGGVELRINPDRPETRRRFSIGHEITHTFFPDHASHAWMRADPRHRDLSKPEDYLEMLCDIGASELVLPVRYFPRDAACVVQAADLLTLARRYKASAEATIRRYAELHSEPVAAVFFTWKLKPAQYQTIGNARQANIFGLDPAKEALAARRLRVEYAVPSERFSADGHYIPRDKSVSHDGPLYEAAASGQPADGEASLELGRSTGRYRIHALPLWTADEDRGPRGENAVAAIVWPLELRSRRKNHESRLPSLFD